MALMRFSSSDNYSISDRTLRRVTQKPSIAELRVGLTDWWQHKLSSLLLLLLFISLISSPSSLCIVCVDTAWHACDLCMILHDSNALWCHSGECRGCRRGNGDISRRAAPLQYISATGSTVKWALESGGRERGNSLCYGHEPGVYVIRLPSMLSASFNLTKRQVELLWIAG